MSEKCPVCSKQYIRRMLFSEEPRIFAYIHAEKRMRHVSFRGVRMYIKEATEACFHREESREVAGKG